MYLLATLTILGPNRPRWRCTANLTMGFTQAVPAFLRLRYLGMSSPFRDFRSTCVLSPRICVQTNVHRTKTKATDHKLMFQNVFREHFVSFSFRRGVTSRLTAIWCSMLDMHSSAVCILKNQKGRRRIKGLEKKVFQIAVFSLKMCCGIWAQYIICLLYTSPSPRDA